MGFNLFLYRTSLCGPLLHSSLVFARAVYDIDLASLGDPICIPQTAMHIVLRRKIYPLPLTDTLLNGGRFQALAGRQLRIGKCFSPLRHLIRDWGDKFQLQDILDAQQFDRDILNAIFILKRPMEDIEKNSPRSQILKGYLMATLFYEPSTRTRLSFESAMKHLGGEVLTTRMHAEVFICKQRRDALRIARSILKTETNYIAKPAASWVDDYFVWMSPKLLVLL
ncbi:hypothetical protein IFM89_008889 [Coptis chinensis]|uniref:Aspartate/ornithine carbamoyltransferase carbamoyl-P binding domain-containing protein n=1 Tax=Coptis chinensis TaxID=261450 RepID=A0A835HUN0_9MAGN|nr:hypothetical protein IFM89_008889 [Coptis chinensis]